MDERFQEYLSDESKLTGWADAIAFPENEEELINVLRENAGKPVTIQGAKTGLAGGAVPEGGLVLNLSRMNHVLGVSKDPENPEITVEPGINLEELDKIIAREFPKKAYFWPPSPTETTASVGGVAATRAKGINACFYGGTENYISSAKLILLDGTSRILPKEEILGSEGILGVISWLTLKLAKKPACVWGVSFFFKDEKEAFAYAEELPRYQKTEEGAALYAMEYMDRATIDLIGHYKSGMTRISMIPDPPEDASALIYLEIGGTEDAVEELAGTLMELADARGSDADEAWAVTDDAGITAARSYRHASAESANLFVEEARRTEPAITKLGTDISFPGRSFGEIVGIYENGLKENGLKGCIFGHISEPCPHVNILAKDIAEYEKGTALLREWSKKFWETDRAAAPEHGIGKLKRRFLCEESLSGIWKKYRDAKTELDPDNCCNRGDVFPEGERFR